MVANVDPIANAQTVAMENDPIIAKIVFIFNNFNVNFALLFSGGNSLIEV